MKKSILLFLLCSFPFFGQAQILINFNAGSSFSRINWDKGEIRNTNGELIGENTTYSQSIGLFIQLEAKYPIKEKIFLGTTISYNNTLSNKLKTNTEFEPFITNPSESNTQFYSFNALSQYKITNQLLLGLEGGLLATSKLSNKVRAGYNFGANASYLLNRFQIKVSYNLAKFKVDDLDPSLHQATLTLGYTIFGK